MTTQTLPAAIIAATCVCLGAVLAPTGGEVVVTHTALAVLGAIFIGLGTVGAAAVFLAVVDPQLRPLPSNGAKESISLTQQEEEPGPARADPSTLTQLRVLYCSDCRASARRHAVAPPHCGWCDRCEADTLSKLIVAHAQTRLAVVMSKRLAQGRHGRSNLAGLRKLVATCYSTGLGA